MKKYSVLILLLAVIIKMTTAEPPEEEDGVLVLTNDNFQETINKHENLLVEFYAPWCGHCKKLAPEYAAAAKELKEEGLYLAKVDATVQKKIASKFQIRGYPTLKFFVFGQPKDYKGGRNKDSIVSWVRKKSGPPSNELKSVEETESLKLKAEVVLVLFGSEGKEEFLKIAKIYDDYTFGHCEVSECIENYKVENGTVVLFKSFDERRNDLPKGYNDETFKKFVKLNGKPNVMKYDTRSSTIVFTEKFPGIFLYRDKNYRHASKLEKIMQDIAPKIKDQLQVIISDIKDQNEKKLAQHIGINKKDLPSVRIHDTRTRLKKYQMKGEITEDNIMKFIQDWKDNKLVESFKSEDIPKSQEKDVYYLVGKNFQSVVIDNEKDVLVEFYIPGCKECKKIDPIYESVAKDLKKNNNLIFAKMDMSKNESSSTTNISKYPTIKLWRAKDKKKPVTFNWKKTYDGLMGFVKKFASQPVAENAKDEL